LIAVPKNIRDHASHDIALAANGANDWCFAGTNAAGAAAFAAFIPMPIFGQAADESFIDLDDTAEFSNVLDERNADLVAHFPCGFIGTEAHISIDLQRAHSLLAGQHQVNDAEPVAKRLVCIFEDSPGDMGKSISGLRGALIALPTPRHCRDLPIDLGPTARAAYTLRPTAPHKIGATSVFVREHALELSDSELVDWFASGALDQAGDGGEQDQAESPTHDTKGGTRLQLLKVADTPA
jgi:hypothetical protein